MSSFQCSIRDRHQPLVLPCSHSTVRGHSLTIWTLLSAATEPLYSPSLMAQVSRAAKPSDDWSEAELISFNIHITDVSQNAFLNTTDITKTPLPMPDTIFDNVDRPVGLLLKDVRLFFQYLKLVQSPSVSCGSRVNDFASFILRMLKFDEPDRVICQQMETTLPMENKHVSVTMDVCIMDEVEIFLIIHECKVRNCDPSS